MTKYYYENKLSNQNLTAKPNVVWVADCTSLDLGMFPKIHLFLCIDIHTNIIVAYKIEKKFSSKISYFINILSVRRVRTRFYSTLFPLFWKTRTSSEALSA